ncbi:MAG: helix-hairpin-helix domain-containing protein [Deltaproteobacteria bacterium]|nr:helix-hairpin-helix domain-containing protein [Deltaproteobacteria bacterium]
MKNCRRDDISFGGLLLLLFLAAAHLLKGFFGLPETELSPYFEKVFVQITGDVAYPGVYAFSKPPGLNLLIKRAGGLILMEQKDRSYNNVFYHSGSKVDVISDGNCLYVQKGEMPAFYKFTCGISISINRESMDGLTVIPGIGPVTAGLIVRERVKRGGFKNLKELISVPGIGPKLYNKASRYLVL